MGGVAFGRQPARLPLRLQRGPNPPYVSRTRHYLQCSQRKAGANGVILWMRADNVPVLTNERQQRRGHFGTDVNQHPPIGFRLEVQWLGWNPGRNWLIPVHLDRINQVAVQLALRRRAGLLFVQQG